MDVSGDWASELYPTERCCLCARWCFLVHRRRAMMKTRLTLLMAALCCSTTCSYSQNAASSQPSTSGIFDPAGLVSPSQHGQLTTLGTGFSFTEGPAVDAHGNVFFTDQ